MLIKGREHAPTLLEDGEMSKIRTLSAMPTPSVYRRGNGEIYTKINEAFHVKAILGDDGSVTGNGFAEELDPDEEVTLLTKPNNRGTAMHKLHDGSYGTRNSRNFRIVVIAFAIVLILVVGVVVY